jgi:hypothetical protein
MKGKGQWTVKNRPIESLEQLKLVTAFFKEMHHLQASRGRANGAGLSAEADGGRWSLDRREDSRPVPRTSCLRWFTGPRDAHLSIARSKMEGASAGHAHPFVKVLRISVRLRLSVARVGGGGDDVSHVRNHITNFRPFWDRREAFQ